MSNKAKIYIVICILLNLIISFFFAKILSVKYSISLNFWSVFSLFILFSFIILLLSYVGLYKLYCKFLSYILNIRFNKVNISFFKNKKFYILLCAAIFFSLLSEGIYCLMEIYNTENVHIFSISNVCIWFLIYLILIAIIELIKKSYPDSFKFNKSFFNGFFADGCIQKPDVIVYISLAAICTFAFCQVDLFITAGCSYAILSGHILDFYQYLASVWGNSNYMITTYFVFAVWNFPIRLITGGKYYIPTDKLSIPVIWWNKLLLIIVFVSTAVLFYKICCCLFFLAFNFSASFFFSICRSNFSSFLSCAFSSDNAFLTSSCFNCVN